MSQKVARRLCCCKDSKWYITLCARLSCTHDAFGIRTGLSFMSVSGQLKMGRQETCQATTESVLPPRCQYSCANCHNARALHACAHDTCANDARDLGCETANTIRQYMEHASARISCNPFIQCPLQRHFLVFLGGSGSGCGLFSTSWVQYHQ